MRQSSNITGREETAALLLRISRDDGEQGESNSIQNQRKLLTKAANEMGYINILEFPDDGVSGTTMNRPGFKAMIKEIERGMIGAVFVKDLSRLGRNYREVGYYTEPQWTRQQKRSCVRQLSRQTFHSISTFSLVARMR